MDANERAEKIAYLFRDEFDVPPYLIPKIAAQIAEAEREAFANGRLDAQYDADTLPEQIEAYKRKAFAEGFIAAKAKAAGVVRDWRCIDGGDKCYPCDCGGEVPQDAIAARIEGMDS